MVKLLEKLEQTHSLSVQEYELLINAYSESLAEIARKKAVEARQKYYGKSVYIRGLIEISSFCKNNCYYCGIRAQNSMASRYRLSSEQIINCAVTGYKLGFRTFVLQGGEDSFYTDQVLTYIISTIKNMFPDCAITLSLGERSYNSYKKLFESGADRYLLRHETASREHYYKLHPQSMSYENRMECLKNLKEIGYAVGIGFMVGSPFQTSKEIAQDLRFIQEFSPDMCGIGPYITHHQTPFANYGSGSVDFTCYLLSLIRLIKPNILLPATTALGTLDSNGREKGILSGANVVMPNLSPIQVRHKYSLYDNKICMDHESAQCLECLKDRLKKIGYNIEINRGDLKNVL